MKNPFAIGEKVYLRPLEPSDAPTVAPWVNDPAVTRTLLVIRPYSVAAEEALLATPGEGLDFRLGIVVREDGALVGVTGLKGVDQVHRGAELGLFVGDRTRWGRGYGTEAARLVVDHGFSTLNLHRIWLRVLAHNVAAIRLYEKLGFRREGLHREAAFREGRYWDDVSMALLAEEWREARSR